MKDILTVAIFDTDSYFAEGIKQALREYFHQKGQSVIFIGNHSEDIPADLIFSSAPPTRRARYCSGINARAWFISIRNKPSACQTYRSACLLEVGTLYRSDPYSAMYLMLDSVLAPTRHFLTTGRCELCNSSQLTRREQEVLDYLREGASQAEVAEKMRLSVKTVSAHKQSARKKMDLMRKHDFIHWLIHN